MRYGFQFGLATLVGVCVGAAIVDAAMNGGIQTLAWADVQGDSQTLSVIESLLVGAAMTAGIVCGTIYTKVAIAEEGKLLSEILQALSSAKMVLAFLAAPLAFFAVYLQVTSIADPLVALLVAFQNGFFWEKTVETVSKSSSKAS